MAAAKHQRLKKFLEIKKARYIQQAKDNLYESYFFHLENSPEKDELMNKAVLSHTAVLTIESILAEYGNIYLK